VAVALFGGGGCRVNPEIFDAAFGDFAGGREVAKVDGDRVGGNAREIEIDGLVACERRRMRLEFEREMVSDVRDELRSALCQRLRNARRRRCGEGRCDS
jgi:hypothetical protein